MAGLTEGFQGKLWIAGVAFDGVYEITRTRREFSSRRDLACGVSAIDGMAIDGLPDRIEKVSFSVKVKEGLTDAMLRHFHRVGSFLNAFDFCPWLWQVESWTWPAGAFVPSALRRFAFDVIPSGSWPNQAATLWPVTDDVDGTEGTATSTGSPNAFGWQPWTPHTTPDEGTTEANVTLFYPAVYRVRVENPQEAFTRPFNEDRSVLFVEV